MAKVLTHKGCKITQTRDGFVWENGYYGLESDEAFPTLDDVYDDIDARFIADVRGGFIPKHLICAA